MRLGPEAGTTRSGLHYILRSPETRDARALLEFLRQQARESYRNLLRGPEVFDQMTTDDEAQVIRGFLEHPVSFLLCAFIEGRLVGNVGITIEPYACTQHVAMLGMGLLKDFQGHGLGRALLCRALKETERKGLWNVQLRVRTFNEPAIRLYESVGFERVGTVRAAARIEGEWCDEHVYQRLATPVTTRYS